MGIPSDTKAHGCFQSNAPSGTRAHGCLHSNAPSGTRAHGCLQSKHHLVQGPMGVYSVYIPVHLHDGTLLIGHAKRVVDGMLQQLLHLACEGDIFLEMLCMCMVCVCMCVCVVCVCVCVWCVCACVCMRVRVIYPCQNFPLHVPSTHMKMLAYPVFEGKEDSRDVDTRLHG